MLSGIVAMAPAPRAILGKYRLVAEIARGGMGIVYLAQIQGPAGFQKLVVVKELKPELADDPKFRDMFLEEASLAARLNHRNIVHTNEVGNDGNRYFMAMDYLDGVSLHRVQKRVKRELVTLGMQLRVLAEVLAGLHYAHELADYDGTHLGVVHRDVGPQNVFVTYDGQVKLLDFGVAKMNRQQETQAGVLKGRVAYMAPEQVGGEKIDRRADVFAAGVLLREILTGQRLWDGLGEIDTLKRLIARNVPAFPADVDVPAELREVCEKAMAPQREDRFATAHEMRVLIEQYVARTDPAGSLASLGALLAVEFAKDRKRQKDVIDAHLASGAKESLPSLELPQSNPELSIPSAVSNSAARAAAPASQPHSSTHSTVVAGEVPGPEATPLGSHPQLLAPSPKSRAMPIAIGLLAVAILAGVFVLGRRSESGTRAAANADPAAANASLAALPTNTAPPADPTPDPNATASPKSELVDLTVRVSPPSAQIFIDDAAVGGTPFRAKYPRSETKSVTIRAVAPGYAPKTESVKLDSNAVVTVSLDRSGGPAVAAAPPTRIERAPAAPGIPPATHPPAASQPATAAPPAAKATDINPNGGKAPKRDIDQKNPYGTE